ncbi:MAG: hypothetical protein CGW95_14340, partial [Phenylobacterium zucineum]
KSGRGRGSYALFENLRDGGDDVNAASKKSKTDLPLAGGGGEFSAAAAPRRGVLRAAGGFGSAYAKHHQELKRKKVEAAARARYLVRERRQLNDTEKEESWAARYLVMGGYLADCASLHRLPESIRAGTKRPDSVSSAIHAGSGQQVFGWSNHQRADVTLFFEKAEGGRQGPAVVMHYNYHGSPWHYLGHSSSCLSKASSTAAAAGDFAWQPASEQRDSFRFGLAEALSAVAPETFLVVYTAKLACGLGHGGALRGMRNPHIIYSSAKDLVLSELGATVSRPPPKKISVAELISGIESRKYRGFVTLRGGQESDKIAREDPAGNAFGFCVQSHCADPSELSSRTGQDIVDYFGWSRLPADAQKRLVSTYLTGSKTPRTLSASTFLSEETVTTEYLRFLMAKREFSGFEITHYLHYEMTDDLGSAYVEPLLQKRHACKLRGEAVAAECLKLLGNGSFGYNGLEACNYASVKLVTDSGVFRMPLAARKSLSVTNTALLGVVKCLQEDGASASLRPAGQWGGYRR